MKFNELVTLPSILRAIEEIGYEDATEIQEKTIPLIKTGVDVIGKSQTGTGKTMAFAIPMCEMIDTEESKRTIQALILCPTRELAMQVSEEIKKLTKYTDGVKTATIYGGSPMERQILNLKKANVVIGTPGRIMDHLRRKTLKLQNLKTIILDEADEMLSMGFKEDIETILADASEEHQTVLFSATMPQGILDITTEFQNSPVTVEVAKKQTTVANISQHYIEVAMGKKMDVLKLLLHKHSNELAMIFCNTKKMVDDIEENLSRAGFKVLGLHGDMKQEQRTKVMNAYKGGQVNILAATDVAARGIDVENINYVINYDLPQNSEYYVHRIGRTGRAGKTGSAITILSGKRQVYELRALERDLKIKIESMPIPSFTDIKESNTEKNVKSVEAIVSTEINETYSKMLDMLVEKGHTAEDIAKAVMQMHFSKLDEALNSIEVIRNKTYSDNEEFTRLKINIGRSKRVAPNHLVAAITEKTGITSKEIGKIEIFDAFSIVGVSKSNVDAVLEKMVDCTICGYEVVTTIDTKIAHAKKFDGRRDFSPRDRRPNNNGGGRRDGFRRDSNRDGVRRDSGNRSYAKKD